MLICVHPGNDKFEPGRQTYHHSFTHSNPLFTPTRNNAAGAHVSSPASWA